MSVGGKVIKHKIFDDKVYIDTDDDGCKCAIYVERDVNSEKVKEGDIVWWQSGKAYWTTEDRKTEIETVLIKRGFSGVPYPHDMPVVQPKFK